MILASDFSDYLGDMGAVVGVIIAVVVIGIFALVIKCYRKVSQGEALIRNGFKGTQVSFSGKIVIPVLHRVEYMDISVKRIEIDRHGAQGLICKDNLRADIKVAFYVRVNNTAEDVKKVAQLIGCERASDERGEVRRVGNGRRRRVLAIRVHRGAAVVRPSSGGRTDHEVIAPCQFERRVAPERVLELFGSVLVDRDGAPFGEQLTNTWL